MIENKKGNTELFKTFFLILLVVIAAMALGIFAYVTFIKDNNVDNNKTTDNGSKTNGKNDNNDRATTDKSWVGEYKTADGKYTLKITENNEVYINDKKIVEDFEREENSKYLRISGDFDPSVGGITGLSFVLNKEKKLIEEIPGESWKNAGSDCGSEYGEYARFYDRCQGFVPINAKGNYFFVISDEVIDTIYTTTWKKLGIMIDDDKADEQGIYVCTNYDDNFNCLKEVKYDANGNALN